MRRIFVTGIGTGIGKTVISAVLAEKLHADYWKPVQCGDLEETDTGKLKKLISNPFSFFHPETYLLPQPLSPHHAAKLEGIKIDEKKLQLPHTENALVIEGAGGVMVPLNDHFLMTDLVEKLATEVVLVSRNYLGSINHTLLSIQALMYRKLPLKGIIFNGETNEQSEKFILEFTGIPLLGRIPESENLNKEFVKQCANQIQI